MPAGANSELSPRTRKSARIPGKIAHKCHDFGTGSRGDGYQDPAGLRTLGAIQADEIASHNHGITRAGDDANSTGGTTEGVANWNGVGSFNTSPTGGVETRPNNVALLFCQRQK